MNTFSIPIPLTNSFKTGRTKAFPTWNFLQSLTDVSSNSRHNWTENQKVVTLVKRVCHSMANTLKL